jgi:inhibitor of cysteine peptidase
MCPFGCIFTEPPQRIEFSLIFIHNVAMKGTIMAIAITTSLVFVLGACSSAPNGGGSKSITIALNGNPTTGYSWTYTMDPQGIVKEVSHEYEASAEGAVGGGGKDTYVFAAQSPGEVQLQFAYARPWETNVKPAQIEIYTLSVDSKLKVKRVSKVTQE